MRDTDKFFAGEKVELFLSGIQAKPKENKIWTIRFKFIISLTAEVLADAPENIVQAFDALVKENSGINPVGLTAEFDEAVFTFYATKETKTPSLEVGGCVIRNMQVERPEKKSVLDDGDVKLRFDLDIPARKDIWGWGYSAFGTTVCAEIESVQMKLKIASDKDGEKKKDDDQPNMFDANNKDAAPATDNKSRAAGEKDDEEDATPVHTPPASSKKKAPAKKKSAKKKH